MGRNLVDHGASFLIAAILGGLIVWGADRFGWGPPDFEAEVRVPDFQVGQDPTVFYQRAIRDNMRGEWTVDLQRRVNGLYADVGACQGGGAANYSVDEQELHNLTVSEYAGLEGRMDDCLSPGVYRLVTSWKMAVVGDRNIQVFWSTSNDFEVKP